MYLYTNVTTNMQARQEIRIPFSTTACGIIMARSSSTWNLNLGMYTGDTIQILTPSPQGDSRVIFNQTSIPSAADNKLYIYRDGDRGDLVIYFNGDAQESMFFYIIGKKGTA